MSTFFYYQLFWQKIFSKKLVSRQLGLLNVLNVEVKFVKDLIDKIQSSCEIYGQYIIWTILYGIYTVHDLKLSHFFPFFVLL